MCRCIALAFILVFSTTNASAQDLRYIKHQITTLSGNTMHGRGYVQKGADRAGHYLVRQFQEMGLRPVGKDSVYTQDYSFPVNTFPGNVSLTIGKKTLVPGEDFLVDARSGSFQGEKLKVKTVDATKAFITTDDSRTLEQRLNPKGAPLVYWKHPDSVVGGSFVHRIAPDSLSKACYIVPVKGKMTWTVATKAFTKGATILYVQDSALPKRMKRTTVTVEAKLVDNNKQFNVMAMVPGTAVPDSFIVFTAHYDHLGMMGRNTLFPGASDNASGTALVLSLARYFVAHPQRYSVLFMLFSGEEAGLKGSKYFTEHPVVPLQQIRFLTNLDIMGDASQGVTVVNATEFSKEFGLLQQINTAQSLLPEIRSRGKAANSDHYFFSEAGVPAFFLYSNGGKGFYHDVFDKANTLSLTNIDKVTVLLEAFADRLQN